MDQALVAHPFEGSVWLEYAHFQTNSGRPSEAIASYQKAFQQDVRCRSAIIADLSPHYPSSYFLRTFPMDRGSLTVLRSTYKGTQDARGYRNVLLQLAKAELESATRSTGEESASHIVTAHGCYAEMGEDDLATSILQKAIKRHSNSYNLRSNLAHWLYNHEQYAESLPHLEWCCRRRPNDKVIRERVDIAELRSHSRIQVADDQSDERRTR